eukprot:4260878-Amphidinium_carterae.1
MCGAQNNNPMRDMVRMTHELIASIQTSAEGVMTETMTLQRAMVTRREKLTEHLESVPSSLVNGCQAQRTRQWHRSREEAAEIATLTAQLSCAESNIRDLEQVSAFEHNVARSILTEGRQFYLYVEQQAKGFSQAEANAARSNADIELRRYREADVVTQQRLLASLES